MNIEIKHCNNIDYANIILNEKKLNIKFAPNGTGKSTIAKAIILSKQEKPDLNQLMPFKLQESNPNGKKTEVNGTADINSVMCFNEEFINQFVFKPDELISNSFEIFIKTDSYKNNEQEIETLVAEIKELFTRSEELETLISTLKQMSEAFKLTKSGISQASTGMKGLSKGNKIQHIPDGLKTYQPFIQCKNSVAWVDWQIKGYEYLELSDNCPFCTSHTADKKERIKQVGREYDKNTIKNLVAIIDIINTLGEYFSDDTRSKLSIITTCKEGLAKEHTDFLISIKTQIDNFLYKLLKLKTLSTFQFKEGEKVNEKLSTYKLDLTFFDILSSDKTQEVIQPINISLDNMIAKAGLLQGKINQQRKQIQKNIEKHEKSINEFLAYAGYRYKVKIFGEGEEAQLKLLHVDNSQHLNGGTQHLSFGEKNAFAIVLFMYECLSKKPDLIILDDPISSFDKNKKYAILEMLFRRKPDACLINQTVLMLTHDIEPIIDAIKSLSDQFSNQTSAFFLKLIKGEIAEIEIKKADIQTFAEICKNVLSTCQDQIVKLVYMRRRYEIGEEKSDAYQILSNLFKKRETPIDTRQQRDQNNKYPTMGLEILDKGCKEISKELPDFSYSSALNQIKNTHKLRSLYHSSNNGYEKLSLARLLIKDIDMANSVIRKFINEAYHIENEFIYQLNPTKFDLIPEYIIAECDKIIEAC